ncbi:MAG: DUF116 domain-containing protein [Thermoplasmata archaeon]|nr:DUF116 domain-containing protein [Thermoplasmata archaeon]
MTKVSTLFRSYGSAANLSIVAQRLPALLIALWLGVISISMIPRLNIIEGGVLFVLFLVSCLLIDSLLNPKRLKNPKIASAIQAFGVKNYTGLIIVHLVVTIILAAHLSYILSKAQIMFIIVIGFMLNVINSRYLSRMKALNNVPNVTGIVGGIMLPMVGAFFVVGYKFDFFTITVIGGIGLIYLGMGIFSQTRKDIEVGNLTSQQNSIEWEALSVAHELGLSSSRIKEIGIELYNIRNENEFKNIPINQRTLFLPHCLRVADRCKASYNEEGLQCKRCTKDCKINIITRAAEKLGYKCFVVPGGAMVFNMAKKYQPKGVVAVACYNELREGASRTGSEYKVPFQIVPLRKDGCVNTDVVLDDVLHTLSYPDNIIDDNN